MRALPIIVIGAALLLASRAARANRVTIDETTGLPEIDLIDDAPASASEIPADEVNAEAYMSDTDTNLRGLLYAIVHSEHNTSDADSGRAYQVFYGGSTFADMSNHPVLTGEKVGVPLPEDWCRRLGFSDGHCVSTAAGAYQINVPTWREFGAGLPDFSMASQDEAARRILAHEGALDALGRGDLSEAIRLASKRWASLPGSRAGQGGRSMAFVVEKYNEGVALA